MSDPADDTPAWAKQLGRRVDSLAEGLEQLRSARTPTERRDARDAVDDDAAALRRLGLSRDQVDQLKKEEQRSQMRELLRELLDEREQESAEAPAADDDAETVTDLRDAAAKRKQGRKVKAPPEPEPDDEPDAAETDQPKSLVQRLGLG